MPAKKELLGGGVNLASLGILGYLLKGDLEKVQAIAQAAEALSDLVKHTPENVDAIKTGIEGLRASANELVSSVNVLVTAVVAAATSLSSPFTRLFAVFRKK